MNYQGNNPFFRGGGGYGHMGAPPQAQAQPMAQPNLAQDVLALRDEINRISQMYSQRVIELETALKLMKDRLDKGDVEFPAQFHSGVVLYPDRYPFPMDFSMQMVTPTGSQPYGLTNEMVSATIKLDVDNPTFLTAIGFDLYKTDAEENTGPIGVYLPLSAQNWNGLLQLTDGAGNVTYEYQGRDFRWRIQTAADDRIWQTGWRSSAQADSAFRQAYKLPLEYEMQRSDTIHIEAEPIAPPADPAQEYNLTVHLSVYKMLALNDRVG